MTLQLASPAQWGLSQPWEPQGVQPEPRAPWVILQKDWALRFLGKLERRKTARAGFGMSVWPWPGLIPLPQWVTWQTDSTCCELGFIILDLTWILSQVWFSCLFPFLLQSGSVKASVGPESWGWFYAFLPSLAQVLKKGSRPWVGNVFLVPDVPQTLFVILDKSPVLLRVTFLICKMGAGLIQKSNFSVPSLPEILKGSPCLWFQKAW